MRFLKIGLLVSWCVLIQLAEVGFSKKKQSKIMHLNVYISTNLNREIKSEKIHPKFWIIVQRRWEYVAFVLFEHWHSAPHLVIHVSSSTNLSELVLPIRFAVHYVRNFGLWNQVQNRRKISWADTCVCARAKSFHSSRGDAVRWYSRVLDVVAIKYCQL